MNTKISRRFVAVSIPFLLAMGACSSLGSKNTGQELSSTGPNVVDVRSTPSTIELNNNWQPNQPPQILAEVKDFNSKIKEVRLRFVRAPLEIPMEFVGGTTWRASLTPQQIKTLAIGGQTTTYEVNVIARNQDGQVAVSKKPLEVAIKGPDLAATPTG
jgi:hypothetical protein